MLKFTSFNGNPVYMSKECIAGFYRPGDRTVMYLNGLDPNWSTVMLSGTVEENKAIYDGVEKSDGILFKKF